jgi:YtkA-like protein
MNMHSTTKRFRLAVCAGLLSATLVVPAFADVKDFEFQLVKSEVKQGDGAIVAVTLMNKRTKQPVPDAVIFAKRIDMAPDGMGEMASPITEVPSDKPGEYRFKTNLSMQGRWQLSLGAKVQGETGSVQSKLVVKAVP